MKNEPAIGFPHTRSKAPKTAQPASIYLFGFRTGTKRPASMEESEDRHDAIVKLLLEQAYAVASTPAGRWQHLHRHLLSPDHHDFLAIHRACFEQVYSCTTKNHHRPSDEDNDEKKNHDDPSTAKNNNIDTAPLWYPTNTMMDDDTSVETKTHCEIVQASLGLSSYHELYQYSITKRDAFWLDAANIRCGIV
jgi:hypothetical protein